ncbi:MAG: ribonuclease H-like domain-containing protein [Lachnospiraceae bacterium]|nr:ribonuclease H-like domain-containing protein [Lachnospiraceae bacterium]
MKSKSFYNKPMITITKEFECTSPYDLSRFGEPEKLLFFDIETTGLSAKQDMVYLIGCVYLRGGSWQMKQWFADSIHAEQEILIHFFLFASRFSTLIHFNGDTFDLPFLRERTAHYQMPVPEKKPVSFDIYRKVRFLKKFLNLPDCRQKTLESFLGIDRKDLYDGGQLIRFYWQYLRTGEASLYEALLLHNEEDIQGLPFLLALLSYRDFFQGPFRTETEQTSPCLAKDGAAGRELMVTCINDSCSLPVPCSFSGINCQFSCHGNSLILRLPLLEGSLKYFFRDYTNYYYLPEEDRAIHKSVAAFVDKEHRKKATAKTCYQNHTSLFFPVPKGICENYPLFYSEYKKNPPYMEYTKGLWTDSSFLQDFLLATLPK